MNKIMVAAVHPDDETLGCGGTLLKYKNNGDEINWLIITKMSKEAGYTNKQIEKRKNEITKVAELYNFNEIIQLDFPAAKLDSVPISNIINSISETVKRIKPNILFIPFFKDVHTDHQIIFNAIWSCTKTFRYPYIKKIYMMETVSETEFAPALQQNSFTPNYFVNIDHYLEKKIEIMKIYKSEIKEEPFPRSIENINAQARFRGSTAGCNFAESFMLLKEIW